MAGDAKCLCKRNVLSVVWNYFDLKETAGKVSCLLCMQELCYNRNTSAMREHLKRKHVYVKLTEDSKDDKPNLVIILTVDVDKFTT